MIARSSCAATILLSLLLILTSASTGAAASQPAGTTPAAESLPGARVAIVVDESGSLTDEAVVQERVAASSVAVVDPSPETMVAIIGFGSSNGESQSATQTYCSLGPTRAPEDRTRLQACAERVHKRTPAEGNDTDFVAAIQAGINEVKGGPEGTPRIIFLLTDGVLDVANSPQFGPVEGTRNGEAERQLDEQVLADARRERVQVWPLGFGDANLQAMSAIAARGSGVNPACVTAGAPKASRASTQTVAQLALAAFASARCGGIASARTPAIDPGGVSEVRLAIPAIATDGSIVVSKPDPDIVVAYLDPDGQSVPSEGTKDGSTFSASGAGRPVESLRITNPKPGLWTVRLTAPLGVAVGAADATAIFTGAVHASVQVSPPAPAAGATVTAQVRVLTRRGAVLDAASLGGLRASLRLTGAGFDPLSVDLNDDGRAPDSRAGDGVFAATFPMPSNAMPGPATIIGVVDAPGLTSDARPYNFVVPAPNVRPVLAEIDLRSPPTLHPGDRLQGSVSVNNPRQSPVNVQFSVEDNSDGAAVTVEPVTVTAQPGATRSALVLPVGTTTSIGPLAFKLVARDGDQVLGSIFFLSRVTRPPGFLAANRNWLGPLAVALLAGVTTLVFLLWSRRPRTVDDLYAKLIDENEQLSGATVRGTQKTTVMHVRVEAGEDGQRPWLEKRQTADSIAISWTRSGKLHYGAATGGEAEVLPGERVVVDGWEGWTITAETNGGEPIPRGGTPVRFTAADRKQRERRVEASASEKSAEREQPAADDVPRPQGPFKADPFEGMFE